MAQAKTLSDTELQRALDYAASTKAAVRNRAILLLTHWAGMRIGEVASVRYSDVLNADKQVLSEIHLAADIFSWQICHEIPLNTMIFPLNTLLTLSVECL